MNKKKSKKIVLETAQDFFDEAVDSEDRGDRWIDGSDVIKAVRFYEQAYEYYSRAIQLISSSNQPTRQHGSLKVEGQQWSSAVWGSIQDKTQESDEEDRDIRLDSLYNILRMQFIVYNKITKVGAAYEIESLDAPEIVKDLTEIANNYYSLLNELGDEAPSDLIHNCAECLLECGEEYDNIEQISIAYSLFGKCLERQSSVEEQLETAVEQLKCLKSALEIKPENGSLYTKLQDLSKEIVQTAYNLVPSSPVFEIPFMRELIQNPLVGRGIQSTQGEPELSLETTKEAVIEIASAFSIIDSSQTLHLFEQLPEWEEKYRALADAYIFQSWNAKADAQWLLLGRAAKALKDALTFSDQLTPDTLRGIWISRGDVEWQRSKIDSEMAQKNKQVLLKNAVTFYTNAINVSSLKEPSQVAARAQKNEAKTKIALIKSESTSNIPGSQYVIQQITNNGIL